MNKLLFYYSLASIWIILSLTSAQGEYKANFRLPNDVVPYHYDVLLTFGHSDKLRTFSGDVDIFMKVQSNTNKIVLHSRVYNIAELQVSKYNNPLPYKSYKENTAADQLVIEFEDELNAGEVYKLSISFVNVFSNDDYGVREIMDDDYNKTFYPVWTHFVPNNAHRAFPCFDEPHLKATFNLTLTYPSNYRAISNTESKSLGIRGDYVVEKFTKSPVMSTYLVAFAIIDYTVVGNDSVRIWGKPGTEDQRNFALLQATNLIEKYNEYTSLNVETFGLGKIDFLPIVDVRDNVMENWGLIVIRSSALYDNGDDTTISQKQNVIDYLSHGIAHFWFGNLVSIKWWSYMWLKESFSIYFAHFLSDSIRNASQKNEQFFFEMQQFIYTKDGRPNSTSPLSFTENEINSAETLYDPYNVVTSYKGAILLRMLYYVLGDKFKSGVQRYLKDNAFKNVSPKDLWDAFESQSPTSLPKGKTIADVMDNWVYKSGYPLITVSYSNNQIRINQTRFCEGVCPDNTTWYVPIFYRKQSTKNSTESLLWLTPDEDLTFTEVLNDDEFVLVNNEGRGFYKVNYDMELLQRIGQALKKDHHQFSTNSRLQIVNDLFTLASESMISYQTLYNITSYLEHERNIFVWKTVMKNFLFLLIFCKDADLKNNMRENLATFFEPFYKSFPHDKTDFSDYEYTFNQNYAYKTACRLHMEDCKKYARKQFGLYKDDPTRYTPNRHFKKFVYCNGMRFSEKPEEDWHFILNEMNKTKSSFEYESLKEALTCTNQPELKMKYMDMFIPVDSSLRDH